MFHFCLDAGGSGGVGRGESLCRGSEKGEIGGSHSVSGVSWNPGSATHSLCNMDRPFPVCLRPLLSQMALSPSLCQSVVEQLNELKLKTEHGTE